MGPAGGQGERQQQSWWQRLRRHRLDRSTTSITLTVLRSLTTSCKNMLLGGEGRPNAAVGAVANTPAPGAFLSKLYPIFADCKSDRWRQLQCANAAIGAHTGARCERRAAAYLALRRNGSWARMCAGRGNDQAHACPLVGADSARGARPRCHAVHVPCRAMRAGGASTLNHLPRLCSANYCLRLPSFSHHVDSHGCMLVHLRLARCQSAHCAAVLVCSSVEAGLGNGAAEAQRHQQLQTKH